MKKKQDNNILYKAITEVVAFFDLFDYSPTIFELWRHISIKCEVEDILLAIENIKEIEKKNAFYFLKGREEIVTIRNSRYNYTDKKIKRAIVVSRIFKFIPWIKMIAIGNIIGSHNLKKESDIDFFVITETNRLWITRIFCVLIIKLLRLRPSPGKERDTICLSFFVGEKEMDLRNLMLKNKKIIGQSSAQNDIYFIYWLAGLVPIYDGGNIYFKFIEKNKWIFGLLPNWQEGGVSYRRNSGEPFSCFYRDVVDMLFGGLDKRVKKIQLKIMPDNLKSTMNTDTRVIVKNNIAKLHSDDGREKYIKKLEESIKNLKNNTTRKKSMDEIIKEYAKKLPKFPDGRIDYSSSGVAPVINCFVRYGGKILLLKRSEKVLAYKNMWNSIGGFLDENKSVKKKMLEEAREELNIRKEDIASVKIGDYYEFDDKDIGRKWIINPAIIDLKREIKIELDWEHTDYAWINPKDINNYDIIPDLDECLKRVLNM